MNLHEYIAELDRLYRTGRATEHTYRPALQALLDTALPALAAINEPARTDCGAPDFILVRRRDNLPVAFVEAKDIDDPDLDGGSGYLPIAVKSKKLANGNTIKSIVIIKE